MTCLNGFAWRQKFVCVSELMRTRMALTLVGAVVAVAVAAAAAARAQRDAGVAKAAVAWQRAPHCATYWESDLLQLSRAQSGRKLWLEPTSAAVAAAEEHLLLCARARARVSARVARCLGFGGALRQHKLPLSGC